MSKNTKQHVNPRERVMGFMYVLLFFLLATTLCAYLLLSNNRDIKVFSQKSLVVIKMERQRQYQLVQAKHAPICDSLYSSIARYNPAVNAKYEENDIKFLIGELRNLTRENMSDRRFMVFRHTADLYEMYFTDKQDMWSKKQNIATFQKDLEACELGLQKKNEELKANK